MTWKSQTSPGHVSKKSVKLRYWNINEVVSKHWFIHWVLALCIRKHNNPIIPLTYLSNTMESLVFHLKSLKTNVGLWYFPLIWDSVRNKLFSIKNHFWLFLVLYFLHIVWFILLFFMYCVFFLIFLLKNN